MAEPPPKDELAWLARADRYVAATVEAEQATQARRQPQNVKPGSNKPAEAEEHGTEGQAPPASTPGQP